MPEFESRPSTQEIQVRAYELYLQRGAEPGRELDDWLAAERELCEHRKSSASTLARTEPKSEEEADGKAAPTRSTRSRAKRYSAVAGADAGSEKHKPF